MVLAAPHAVRFIKLLARRLHQHGAGSHRLEAAVQSVADRLGVECEIFSTPTSVLLTFAGQTAEPEDQVVHLLRLNPGSDDLARLCQTDAVAEAVANGEMTLPEGVEALNQVGEGPQIGTPVLYVVAWAVVAVNVCHLLGATWVDMALAAVIAVLAALFTLATPRLQELGSFELIIAFGVTALAHLLAALFGGYYVPHIVTGALIILMPGLDLTTAVTELSTRHLASGTARFAGAIIVLVKLALGVVMATQLVSALGIDQGQLSPALMVPDWFTWLAVPAVGVAFGVLFRAQLSDFPAMVVAGSAAFSVNALASHLLDPTAGIFIASLMVAAMSNAYSRLLSRPAAVVRLPGIIMLVPGSLSYRALTLMFSQDVAQGLDAAAGVGLVLAALVGGLLLGNTVIPPRRHL